MRQTKILAVIAGLLTAACANAGDVYKYVDERGNTLYTDKPMPGAVLVSAGTTRSREALRLPRSRRRSSCVVPGSAV